MMLPGLALALTEGQWHYLTFLGTARLGKAETPVLMGQALPAAPDPLAPWHMANHLAARCWSQISRHASSAQSCRSLFDFPPGISITQGLQEQTRDQAELLRPPSRDEWLRPGV